jgi:hypothetical protein
MLVDQSKTDPFLSFQCLDKYETTEKLRVNDLIIMMRLTTTKNVF